MHKTISFLKQVDGIPVENDLNEMITEMKKNYNNMGLGNFIIKIYREWKTLKKELNDQKQLVYYKTVEIEKLKKEIEGE